MTTGFTQTVQGIYIEKDPQAVLTYTFDWQQWLPEGDAISAVEYTAQARSNDPTPIVIDNSGVQTGRYTYVTLSAGQTDKIYIITAKVTTVDGLVDRRNFRIKITNRAAE
jgi:hypothetical protein